MRRVGWLIIVGSFVPVIAQAAPDQNRGGCRTEVQSICGESRGDRAARRACIEAHLSQFSEACQAKLARRIQAGADGQRRGCRSQVKSICGSHRGVPEAMKVCFETNRDQFTARCQARLDARDWSKGTGKRGMCRAEVKTLCGGHRGDRNAMQQCLQANLAQFSETCQHRMQRRLARFSHHGQRSQAR
ncbi:MAG: hypothetical protein VX589_05700 [Myxococcota bacterium]|nr:hypothetical protein [Myxococcota bacterium]